MVIFSSMTKKEMLNSLGVICQAMVRANKHYVCEESQGAIELTKKLITEVRRRRGKKS